MSSTTTESKKKAKVTEFEYPDDFLYAGELARMLQMADVDKLICTLFICRSHQIHCDTDAKITRMDWGKYTVEACGATLQFHVKDRTGFEELRRMPSGDSLSSCNVKFRLCKQPEKEGEAGFRRDFRKLQQVVENFEKEDDDIERANSEFDEKLAARRRLLIKKVTDVIVEQEPNVDIYVDYREIVVHAISAYENVFD